jgi:multidrug efflux pump subunit AcrA (membrane-fusion protein)
MKHDSLQSPQSSPPQEIQSDTNRAIQQDLIDLPSNETELVNNKRKTNLAQKSWRRIWLYLLLGIGIVGLSGLLFRQLQNNPQVAPTETAQPAKLSVRATKVKIQPLQKFVFGDGYVWAVRRKHLAFETSGTITYIKKNNGRELREGDFVKAGELLAKVDDRKQAAELAQARAKTAQAQTQSVAAQADISQANASVEQAKADVVRALAENESFQDAYRLAASEVTYPHFRFAVSVGFSVTPL